MYDTEHMNILIDSFGMLVSIVLLILLTTSGDRNSKLNRLFIRLVVCNAVMLAFDLLSWSLVGSTGAYASLAVRAAVFLCYSLSYFITVLLADYVFAFIGGSAKISKNIFRVFRALFGIIIALVVLSQFNGMYYYFDGDNMYRTGEYFWLGQVLGLLLVSIVAAMVLRHRKSLGSKDTIFLLSFIFIPTVTLIIQTIFYKDLELIFVAYILSLIIIYGGIQARQEKRLKELELKLAEGRVATMLSQIQPHFLYNALTAIEELCATDAETARQTVIEFSRYLRGNLDSLELTKPILFERELMHVETYLTLEKKRFNYKLNVDYDIKARDFMLPALSLQPIVENAVRHGVTKRAKGGTVSIKTEETKTAFLITVTDDGVGFDVKEKFNKRETGAEDSGRNNTGIEDVRKRLAFMCGGTLEITSAPGRGTTAVISLPKN